MKRKIQNTIFFIQFVFSKLCILDSDLPGMGADNKKIDFLTEKYCTMDRVLAEGIAYST